MCSVVSGACPVTVVCDCDLCVGVCEWLSVCGGYVCWWCMLFHMLCCLRVEFVCVLHIFVCVVELGV